VRRALVCLIVVVVFGAHGGVTPIVDARAQTPSHPSGDDRVTPSSSSVVPVLTSDQRTHLQLRVLIYRNAQLELEAAVKDLTKPGFTLDLNTLSYVPQEAKAVTP
jgi:hypothetical protein